jgi:hypothetical protein
MTKHLKLCMAMSAISCLTAIQPAFGQGCIISRSNGEVGGPQSEGGYLQPGEFNVQVGYRHQFSFRHFVGPQEQTYRIEQGTQVMNKINLQNYALTYQLTSRFSVTADVPLLLASRHQHNSPITYTTSGIGDSAFMVNGWIWNPKENTRGNVELGIGLLLPTGKNNITNNVDALTGKGPQTVVVDYSIQPGQGGWGIPLQWVGYKNVGNSQLYFNGVYTAMLQSINYNTLRSTTTNPVTLTQYNSISDQYLLEAGIAHPISKIKGLTLTVGPRMEGAPARNLFPGDNLGFRRPGFAISVEPGFQYARGGSVFTAQVGKAFYRDRTRSVPDVLTNGHGDAAFADYVWLASYSYRFSPFNHGAHADHNMPDHSANHNAGDHTAAAAAAPTSASLN